MVFYIVGVNPPAREARNLVQACVNQPLEGFLVAAIVLKQKVPVDDIVTSDLNRPMPAHSMLFKAFQESLEIPIDQRRMARSVKVDVAEMRQPGSRTISGCETSAPEDDGEADSLSPC